MQKQNNPGLVAYSLLISLGLIWGTSFILIKKGLISFTPLQVGTLRILIGSVALLPFSIPRLSKLNLRDLGLISLSGFLGSFFPSLLFSIAGTRIMSSVSGSLNATTPFFTILVGALAFRQKPGLTKILGLLLGLMGCIVLSFSKVESWDKIEINAFAGLLLMATLMYGLNINLVKYFLAGKEPIAISSLSIFVPGIISGLLLFGPLNVFGTFKAQPEAGFSLACVALMGLMGTAFSSVLFNRLIQQTSPTFASSCTYLIPVFAILWGLLDGEKILPVQLLGVLGVLAGVLLVTRAK